MQVQHTPLKVCRLRPLKEASPEMGHNLLANIFSASKLLCYICDYAL